MSTEMGISCQQNGHWAATNHLSSFGLVQPIKELLSVTGRFAGRGCALIRQLANTVLLFRKKWFALMDTSVPVRNLHK